MCVNEETWRDLADLYLNARLRRGIVEAGRVRDRHVLRLFRWFLERDRVDRPRALTRRHLEAWEDFLENDYRSRASRTRGLPITSVTRYGWTSVVLQFVEFLVRTDRLVVDPRVGFLRSRIRRTPRRQIPTEDEVVTFLETIAGLDLAIARDRALFELLYNAGLRRRETCHLDLYDVDFTTLSVKIRQGKGGFDRVVPLGQTPAAFLRHYLVELRHLWWTPKAGDAFFVTQPGNRITASTLGRRCQLWAARAGLPHITPHKLRHACATHMLTAGAGIRHVQVLLGHQEITTTQAYTHVINPDLKAAHRRSHPRGS